MNFNARTGGTTGSTSAVRGPLSLPAPRHGELPAPNVEQLLEPDPEVYLAGGPLHDPCKGGPECDAMCVCGGDE